MQASFIKEQHKRRFEKTEMSLPAIGDVFGNNDGKQPEKPKPENLDCLKLDIHANTFHNKFKIFHQSMMTVQSGLYKQPKDQEVTIINGLLNNI